MSYSYQLARNLVRELPGRSCVISRVHPPEDIIRPDNFKTLHAITSIILRQQGNPDLAGYMMYDAIKEAMELIFSRKFLDTEVLPYYYSIRGFNNGSSQVSDLEKGEEVLSCYKFIMSKGQDWDASLKNATWYLNSGVVTSLNRFNFDNVMLVQSQFLLEKRNKNALEFFNSLCDWLEKHRNCRVITLSDSGAIEYGALQPHLGIHNL